MSRIKVKNERLYDVIKRPLITEKTTAMLSSNNQYTFEVLMDATKVEIKQAVELLFPGKKVISVKTVYMPSHEKRVGVKSGRTQSSKKAIVKIEGEPIEDLVGA